MEILVLIHQRSDDEQTWNSFLGLLIISVLVWSLPAEVALFCSYQSSLSLQQCPYTGYRLHLIQLVTATHQTRSEISLKHLLSQNTSKTGGSLRGEGSWE